MDVLAVVVSFLALVVSGWVASRQLTVARAANSMPVLIDLFREHRGSELADARVYIHKRLDATHFDKGIAGIPASKRKTVLQLMWFYDNLGVLVAHRIVPIEPVTGYLGGAVDAAWRRLEPMARAERKLRTSGGLEPDPERWQSYFEILANAVRDRTPHAARQKARWSKVRSE